MAGRSESDPLSFTVTDDDAGSRLDQYLQQCVPDQSRSQLQKWIRSQLVLVNEQVQPARYLVSAGDVVVIAELEAQAAPSFIPIPMNLAVVFEDEHVIVVDKQAGIAVHPGAGETKPTLVQGVLAHCQSLSRLPGGDDSRPGVVHRLDKDTTGLIVFTKTESAHRHLAQQFHDKTNLRSYRALLDGRLSAAKVGVVQSYLHRDAKNRVKFASMPVSEFEVKFGAGNKRPGFRYAESVFSTTTVFADRLTEVQVQLKTGRTHQIRVHAAAIGCPVWGDRLYGRPGQMLPKTLPPDVQALLQSINRQLLHAETLGFRHPKTEEWHSFSAPLPADFAEVRAALAPFCPPAIP